MEGFMSDFALGLDFLAALFTLFYIAKLVAYDLLLENSDDELLQFGSGRHFNSPLANRFEKRSLLNQQIYKRS